MSLIGLAPLSAIGAIVMIGIYTGVWTPTEAAAGGCVVTLVIVGLLRGINRDMLFESVYITLLTSSMILMILVGSSIIAYITNFPQIPTALLSLMGGANINPYQILIFCCVIFFVLGAFIDGLSISVITVPIVLPIMTSVGFDPVWFGIVFAILIDV